MKNKFCQKGYSCGGGCINVSYICRKEFPEGVSISINSLRKQILDERSRRDKEIDLHTSVTVSELTGKITYEYQKDKVNVKVFWEQKQDKIGEILFAVNDSYMLDKFNPLNPREKIEATRAYKRLAKRLITTELKEGTLVTASPQDGDGKYEARKRDYLRAGFREEGGLLRAVYRNNKLYPLTQKQFFKMRDKIQEANRKKIELEMEDLDDMDFDLDIDDLAIELDDLF